MREEETFTINVSDENDEQPVFTPNSVNLSCEENLRDGASCGSVTAIDLDEGNAGEVEYSLVTIHIFSCDVF